jgi:hypothetical protein
MVQQNQSVMPYAVGNLALQQPFLFLDALPFWTDAWGITLFNY